MIDQLTEIIERMFEEAPHTRAAYELKEELRANCIERYNDLVGQGMSQEDAFHNVVDSIGNVNDLFQSLEEPINQSQEEEERRKKSALLVSASVGIYIVAFIIFLGLSSIFHFETGGLIIGLLICIAPTCMLVYNALSQPAYRKSSDTMVEDFKVFTDSNKRSKAMRGAISTILWSACLVLYFVFSFATGAWHVTWVIFLIFACLEGVLNLLFQLRR